MAAARFRSTCRSGPSSGASLLLIFGIVLVIPAPWAGTGFYRWIVPRIAGAGTAQSRLHRPGRRSSGTSSSLTGLLELCGRLSTSTLPTHRDSGFRRSCRGCCCDGLSSNLSFERTAAADRLQRQRGDLSSAGTLLLYISVITIIGWAWVITAWMRWICRNVERHAARSRLQRHRPGSTVADDRVRDRLRLPDSDSVGVALVWPLVRFAVRAGRTER